MLFIGVYSLYVKHQKNTNMLLVNSLVILSVFTLVAGDELVVQVKNGLVRGRIQSSLTGFSFYAWQGIPYAAPPVGSLRFQAPQAASDWSGIKNTTKDTVSCYQVKDDSSGESEDCLVLNVYTPSHKGSGNLPVMFWIYGGAFRGGSGSFNGYGPHWLVEQDVIVVTHNYRVGPFGFLSTGDTVVPGNAGLKDQAFAIKWTYDNIAAFGGDPNKITIFGQSAGSASVGYQVLSPLNKGLIRGAIQQSGSPLNGWASIQDPKSYVASLIQQIDPNTTVGSSSEEQLAYLQNVEAKDIDHASKSTTPSLTLPVVEVEHDGAFITQTMYEAFESGNFNQIPTIIGCNSEEDIYMLHSHKDLKVKGRAYDANLETLIPHRLVTEEGNREQLAKDIKSIYLNETQLFADNAAEVIRFSSDDGFNRGAIKQAELMSSYSNVYFYILSYDGELGGWNISIEGAGKVEHGEDIKYIWVHKSGSHTNEDLSKYPESDQTTSHRMVKMWTNFAKTLNPTPEPSDLLQNAVWPTFNGNSYPYMGIDTDLEIKADPKPIYSPWKAVYEKYATKPYVIF